MFIKLIYDLTFFYIHRELNSQQCDLQQTPLHLAVESGQNEIVQELLLCGVSVDVPDANGENVFHAVAKLPPEAIKSISAVSPSHFTNC